MEECVCVEGCGFHLRSWRTCLILSSFRFTTLSKRPRSRAAQNVDSYILSWVALFLYFCYYPGYIWSWTTVLAGNSSFTSVELGASPKGGRGAQQIEIGELKKKHLMNREGKKTRLLRKSLTNHVLMYWRYLFIKIGS